MPDDLNQSIVIGRGVMITNEEEIKTEGIVEGE
jgi:hypothetical protein